MISVFRIETNGLFMLVSLFSNRISITSFLNNREGLSDLRELGVKLNSLGDQELDEEILS